MTPVPGRRSLLLGGIGLGGASALPLGQAVSAAVGRPSGSTAQMPDQFSFDLDTGNFIRDFRSLDFGEPDGDAISGFIAPMDVTLQVRINTMVYFAWYEAMAPYHPTAVGVYSRLGRRPASESATNRNLNIAGLYATFRVITALVPERVPVYREILSTFGLDPDDTSEDRTSPVGLGNLAGRAVVEAGRRDGMNELGGEGRSHGGQPYEDYTGYRPVNTAYELSHPSRWQPNLAVHNRRQGEKLGDKGIFTGQHFATPQMRLAKAHTFTDPSRFRLAPPRHLDHTRPAAYKRAVDEVLAASAALTDERKLVAEFVDNLLVSIGLPAYAAVNAHGALDMHGWCHLWLTYTMAMWDSLIATWHHKTGYDAVRPFSAIRHVYGSGPVTAWGGPGMGTVDDLPAEEWVGYLNVPDHPEYPSGYAVALAAEAQAVRRFLGDDVLDFTLTFPAGSSVVEPGITPARDVELRWDTWTEWVRDVADSRVWAGVHFPETVESSIGFGEQFGDLAYEFVQRYVNGEVED